MLVILDKEKIAGEARLDGIYEAGVAVEMPDQQAQRWIARGVAKSVDTSAEDKKLEAAEKSLTDKAEAAAKAAANKKAADDKKAADAEKKKAAADKRKAATAKKKEAATKKRRGKK